MTHSKIEILKSSIIHDPAFADPDLTATILALLDDPDPLKSLDWLEANSDNESVVGDADKVIVLETIDYIRNELQGSSQ